MICIQNSCGKPAYADIQWGPDTAHQCATLCKDCVEAMWKQYSGAIAAGLLHYRIGPPGSIVPSDKKEDGK